MRPPGPDFVRRFALPVRLAHWALAICFLLLLLTGLTNYQPRLKAIEVANFRLFGWAHVVLGFVFLGLVVFVLLSLLRSRALRHDAQAMTYLRLDDYLWLQHEALSFTGARSVPPPVGKFNAGQKLNALASAAGTGALLATGLILGINYVSKRVFGATFVASVFPWHTAIALLMIPLIAGHIYLAAINSSTREALRGITMGVVRRDWALRHHGAWRPEDNETR